MAGRYYDWIGRVANLQADVNSVGANSICGVEPARKSDFVRPARSRTIGGDTVSDLGSLIH